MTIKMRQKALACTIVISLFLLLISDFPFLGSNLVTAADADYTKAVVLVKSFSLDSNYYLKQYGFGSGVLLNANGIILTNYHVVTAKDEIDDKTSTHQVCISDTANAEPNCSYTAALITRSADLDLALLKIIPVAGASTANLQYLSLNAADTIKVGDEVTAVGYPAIGGATMTTTKGIVSGKIDNQYNKKWLKTDALVSFGSSGGALIDASGKLVGITTALSSDLSSSLGYAINIASANNWITSNLSAAPIYDNPLLDKIKILTEKQKNANNSDLLDDAKLPFSIVKPNDWSFKYVGESSINFYNVNDKDGGIVSIEALPVAYFAPANAASSVLKRYFNELGVSSLITIPQDKEVTVNANKGRLLTLSALGSSINYYAFAVHNYFVFLSYEYGKDNKDKATVDQAINTIRLKAVSDGFKEQKEFSLPAIKLNFKTSGNWVFKKINGGLKVLDVFNRKTYDAYGQIKLIKATEQTHKMTNQQYLDYLKQTVKQANQLTRILDYEFEVTKTVANVNLGKIKNAIRLDGVERNVSDKKIFAYDTEYYVNLGDVYLSLNLTVYNADKKVYTRALAEFNTLLRNLTVDTDRKATLEVSRLILAKNFGQAIKAVDSVKNIENKVSLLASITSAQADNNLYQDALKTAQKMNKFKPKDYYTLNYLGWAYLNTKDYKNAEKYLKVSIKANGKYQLARRNLARTYINLKKYDLAQKELQAAITLDPNNSLGYYYFGMIYYQTEKYSQAIESFEKSLQLDAAYPYLTQDQILAVKYDLATLYFYYVTRDDQYQKVVDYISDYLKAKPNDQTAQDMLNGANYCIDNYCGTDAKVISCQDFDGGINYSVKSKGVETYSNGKTKTIWDSCMIKDNQNSGWLQTVNSCQGDNCYVYEIYVRSANEYCEQSGRKCSAGCNDGVCLNPDAISCPVNQHEENNVCMPNTTSCSGPNIVTGGYGSMTWSGMSWGVCTFVGCMSGYEKINDTCQLSTQSL